MEPGIVEEIGKGIDNKLRRIHFSKDYQQWLEIVKLTGLNERTKKPAHDFVAFVQGIRLLCRRKGEPLQGSDLDQVIASNGVFRVKESDKRDVLRCRVLI